MTLVRKITGVRESDIKEQWWIDPVTRQVGQHIEMEPEWEAAFTLQMKLTHVISMMQDWCALDVSLFWGQG